MTVVGLKVLILGGYGTFGGRLAQLLKNEPRVTLLISGRSLEKAQAFCDALGGEAKAEPAVFDRDGDVESQLRALAPHIVVDASGPFQDYHDPYAVVRAAIALGIHYLDLADGSDFVRGVAAFDAQAKAKNLFILSGVSSFPVLTAAVVRKLSPGMTRVLHVTGGIAPSPYAGVGLNVIRAVASYGGKPIAPRRDGKGTEYALISSRRFTIAPPGKMPLDPIRFSLVDVPDSVLLPDLWPSLKSVWMGAGPVPAVLHRALSALAYVVRLGIFKSLSPFAPMMYRTINVLRWGEHRGGMFVLVEGEDAIGQPLVRSWHLLAEGDHGPLIPSMASEVIIRKYLDGVAPLSGARSAATDLELSDYQTAFTPRTITTGVRQEMPREQDRPLTQRILGDAWYDLPEPVRAMHNVAGTSVAEGRASVERGTNVISRVVATLFQFPKAAADIPVRVTFRREEGSELWTRDFAGRKFSSIQSQGYGRFERLLCETFGLFAFGVALVHEGGRLRVIVRKWTAFGIPMPRALAPFGEAYESPDNGRFNFYVEINLPLIGLIVRYRGWLVTV